MTKATLVAFCVVVSLTVRARPNEERRAECAAQAQRLIDQLSGEERLSQLMMDSPAVERLGIPKYHWWNEALHGDARAGLATVFPQSIALAATFDENLMRRMGDIVSTEARAKYNLFSAKGLRNIYFGLTLWSPNVNMFRDPRWGRGQETFGEDPFLSGQMGGAYVRGLQGDDPRYLKCAACAKHFAVHSGPEALRHGFDAKISPRDLAEYYLPAFKALAVDAQVEAFMGAYSALNGTPCCANRGLLTDLLRGEWGFRGHVVSDVGAVGDIASGHRFMTDRVAACRAAIAAGLDLCSETTYRCLAPEVRSGAIPADELAAPLRRLYTTRALLGQFDPPGSTPWDKLGAADVATSAHRAVALEAAEKSLVLISNNGVLPIDASRESCIAVVGPRACDEIALVGNYCGFSDAPVTCMSGFLRAAGPGVKIETGSEAFGWGTDLAVACLGITAEDEGEEGCSVNNKSGDRSAYGLPPDQIELLKRIRKRFKRVVTVVFGGSPFDLKPVCELSDAVMLAWYPGELGGLAVARAVLGQVNPSGRLPITYPKSYDDLPDFKDYSLAGRTYLYADREPLYPFGYGLSYTRFAYENATVVGKDAVSVTVRNVGSVAGDEVVQAYVRAPAAAKDRRRHHLAGFARVRLAPGEAKDVTITLPRSAFAVYDEDGRATYPEQPSTVFLGGGQPGSTETVSVAVPCATRVCIRNKKAPDSTIDVPFAKMSVEVWEVTRRANADVVVGAMDLSKADGWRKVDKSVAAAVAKDADGPFLRLGDGKHLGLSTAVELPDLVPVREGETYTLAFEARANGGEDIAMFYLRTFDCDRRDVTGPIVVPHGWAFTPYSKAYWENGFHFSSTGKWQRFSKTVSVPLGVRYLQPMAAMWRGQTMDVRNLRVTLHRPTEARRVDPAEIGLKLDVACEGDAEKGTLVRATVRDLMPRPRALKLVLNAARDLAGWTYHDNWRVSKTIAGNGAYGFDALVSGHPISRYPFTAVSKDGAGFAIGTPFDAPVFESRTVTTNGIRSTYVLGLLPRADGRHGGRPSQDGERFGTTATVEWLVLPFKGNWGFRSAARAYYAREAHKIPDLWKGRREGTWLWPIFPSKLPKNPDDFGLTLWEAPSGIGRNPGEIEAAHKLGIEVYPYTEAWGLRQEIKTGADGRMTTVEERIAELERWAAETNTTERWRGVPRNVAARACLNSLPVLPDGTHPFSVDKYGVLAHWWMTNADPRLREKPNRHSICWDEAKVGLDLVDGIYLDSVTAIHSSYVNVRPEHLAVMDENLIYDPETAVPCASGMHHQTAFIKWLAAELHPKGKRIFGNAFRIAQRFHATTADIFGGEVGGWGRADGEARQHRAEPDDAACEKRFYAYHRPVANLLQEGCFWAKAPELSAKGVENYVEHHLFYGFFPGITTIGGDKVVDYAKWMRYFGPTRQCERDRAVFQKAIPLIRRLHAAGWEPETFLRSSLDHVWVERYGSTKGGKPCYFTLRNDSEKACAVELTLEPNGEVSCTSFKSLWKQSAPAKTATGWKMTLEPWATAVLAAENLNR